MRLGWRPLGHVSINTYLAPAIFYLNMYYSKGVSLSFEMLACNTKDDRPYGDGASCYDGGCYLIAQPGMTCWEGEHRRNAALKLRAKQPPLVRRIEGHRHHEYGSRAPT